MLTNDELRQKLKEVESDLRGTSAHEAARVVAAITTGNNTSVAVSMGELRLACR